MKNATLGSLRQAIAQPELSSVLRNTAWLFADRLVRIGLTLLISAWLARYLGAAGYGIYSYVFVIIALFGALASAGLEDVVVRDLVKAPERRDEIIGTTFCLKFGFAILAGSLAVLTIAAIRPGEHLLIELTAIAASGFLFEAFQTLALWFQSQIQAKYAVVAKSSILILMNLVKIVLLLGVASIHAFVWAACVESLLVAVALAAIYRFKGNSFRNWRYNPAYAWGLLRECWPLAVAGLVGIAYGKLSQLMIGGMLGNEAVGIYSAAVRLSDAWTVIPVAIITSAFPSLVAAQNVSPALYTRRLQTLCNIITALGVAVAIPMTVLATPVIEAFFGSAYAAAGPVLAISVWGGVFVFMGMVQSCWYISEGLTRMALKRTIICALLNVVLNAILIPRYAFIGAACATAITHAVNAWAINLTDARTRPFFLLQLRAFAFRPPVFRWSEPESIRG